MRQLNAFPIALMSVDPANLGTADAALFGAGVNGLDYCVKTTDKTPLVPGAELICYLLADYCGISIPQFDIVELPTGGLAFGSVWDGSAADKATSAQVLQGRSAGKQIARTLSRIYAFDLFVHNIDRHLGNYLCVGGRVPGHSVKAYDFSRAFTAHGWPLPSLPMSPRSKTVYVYRLLRRFHSFDLAEANGILKKIRDVPDRAFEEMVKSVPTTWLEPNARAQLIAWWAIDRASRIDRITGGLKDGSFL